MGIQLKSRAFLQTFGDAIYHAYVAQNLREHPDGGRHARSSILSIAVSVECAANCCIAAVEATQKCRDDLDKLTPISKFELAARLEGKECHRDRNEWIAVGEIASLRNSYVHPKESNVDVEVESIRELDDLVAMKLLLAGKETACLGVDNNAQFWCPDDAHRSLKGVVSFFNFYFVDVMELTSAETLGLLCPLLCVGESVLVFQQECFADDILLLEKMDIRNRFFDLSALPKLTR